MIRDLDEIMKLANPHVAVVAHVADLVNAMGAVITAVENPAAKAEFHGEQKIHNEIKAQAERAKEILGKAVKVKIDQNLSDSTVHLPRLVKNWRPSPWMSRDARRRRAGSWRFLIRRRSKKRAPRWVCWTACAKFWKP